MSNLEEVQKRVFLGTVPVRVELDYLDMPLCFNIPRSSPLPLFLYNKIGNELGDNCENFCLLVNKTDPIQPNIPIGVIYDSYFPPKSEFQPLSVFVNTKNKTEQLYKVLQCPSEGIASHYFRHLFKENVFLTDGNLSVLQQNTNIHAKIEDAVLKLDYSSYAALRKIIEENSEKRQFWPVKVYQKGERIKQCFLKVNPDTQQTLADALKMKDINQEKVIIQGIEVDTATKLDDLMKALSYADGFLYVTLN